MSSGQKPRTPRYFPRMKVRGARRRRQAHWDYVTGLFERLYEPRSAEALAEMQHAFAEFAGRAVTTMETLTNIRASIMKEDRGIIQ